MSGGLLAPQFLRLSVIVVVLLIVYDAPTKQASATRVAIQREH